MINMKQLSDIPRKNIFEVPEGYFDRLPAIIQARTQPSASVRPRFSGNPVVRYAFYSLLVVLSVAALYLWLQPPAHPSAESLLAEVEVEYLMEYLEESDISVDEVWQEFGVEEAEAIENEVFESLWNDNILEILESY
jgi:hypothetical protein